MLKNPGKSSNFEVLSSLLRLRQICCHPALLPPECASSEISSAKTELMKELVYQNIDEGHKILLFSQFTSLLKIVREWMDESKIKYEYLDGSTKDRMRRVDNFNNSKNIPVFLLSLKAGGTGLNLTAADTVIIYDPWWNPAVEAQATDRSHRIGQTVPVNSMKLVVEDSIEERILSLQERKKDIFNNLVDNPEATVKKLDTEALSYILE
jgi:non-specific serine/threonine protein kinase